MILPSAQACIRFATVFVLLLGGATAWCQEPNASEILQSARVNPMGQAIVLKAQLRADNVKVPFIIRVGDGAIAYEFNSPDQAIILEFGDKSAKLTERLGKKSAPVRSVRNDDSIRRSLITYEDLALSFLFWPDPKLIGEETVRTRRAWEIEVPGPETSQYSTVRVWIDKESGALLRIEGKDKQGRLARRFEVVSAQKLDGQWMLKQMRVERLDPETGKVTGRTYLEVLGKG